MKQLLIVNSAKALNAGITSAKDLSGLEAGAITFFELGESTLLSAAPTKNFAIALGGGTNKMPFVIPEVDYNSVEVTKSVPKLGTAFTATITVPTTAAGNTYTIVLIKNGTVPHERNTWTVTESIRFGADTTNTYTASYIAGKLRNSFQKLADNGLPITVSGTGANVTITGKNVGEQWTLKASDDMSEVAATSVTDATPTIGDKAYIQDLASRCAAGKGFTDTHEFGPTVYPGYPEAVEDITPNTSGTGGATTAGYVVYTLRFQVGRAAAKTRDEKVWQVVHIAIPMGSGTSGATSTAVDTILTGIKAPVTTNTSEG